MSTMASSTSSSSSSSSPLFFFVSSSFSQHRLLLRRRRGRRLQPDVTIALSSSSSTSSSSSVAPLLCRSPESSLSVPHAAVSTGYIDDPSYDDDDDDDYGDEEEEEGKVRFPSYLKVFVGNLPSRFDSGRLGRLFSRAGTVEMAQVIYDRSTGRSRRFGFVTMSTTEEVEEALLQFDGYELGGRILRVNSDPPPRPSRGSHTGGVLDPANRLFVGNLSWGVDNLALETLFSESGKVLEAKIIYNRETGRSRGFGFVTYSSSEGVANALSSLNGIELDGRAIRVMKAEAKPDRPS